MCNKVSANIKKELDSEPVQNKKILKTKIKSYGDEATDFHDDEMLKPGSDHACSNRLILVFKKVKTINHKCFQKNSITMKKKGDQTYYSRLKNIF